MRSKLWRIALLWIAGTLAAALPLAAQVTTHPEPAYGVVTSTLGPQAGTLEAGKAEAGKQQAVPDASLPCPVTMQAHWRAGLGIMQARDGAQPVAAQRIYLEINPVKIHSVKIDPGKPDPGKPGVDEVRVTVYGTRAQAQSSLVLHSSRTMGTAKISHSFTLKPNGQDAGKIAAELALEGFTSVQSIRLDSVSYKDGTGWTAIAGHACSAQVDPLMLVSQR